MNEKTWDLYAPKYKKRICKQIMEQHLKLAGIKFKHQWSDKDYLEWSERRQIYEI